MIQLQKLTLATLVLGSSTLFAGTMGPSCLPGSVTVPCEASAWDFGIQALYLRAVNEDYQQSRVVGLTEYYDDHDHDWGWGFRLEGSYHFNTGNDIDINWYHYRRSSSTVFTPTAPGALFSFATEPKWDAVNFEFGQNVNLGEQTNIRFHGGLDYTRFEKDYTIANSPIGWVRTGGTKFTGVGPRTGFDLSYNLANGFGVYGKGAATLLVGDDKFFQTTVGPFPTAYVSGSKRTVIPAMDGKLGVTYTYAMAQGLFSLDAGYLWVHYFDVDQFGFAGSGKRSFGLEGVVAGVKWVGFLA
ncbi:MAG: Lpg1974 family pore-forming outer membrane protein [Legionella sp.]|nr:Lpg1974 family pore-forming outer membrane protein [Legionella sp.]